MADEVIKADSLRPVETSPGMNLLTQALIVVEQACQKADDALVKINQNLTTLQNQRIGLAAQKGMLVELRKKLEEEEAKAKTTTEE
jgi:hypothetical protein